MLLDDKVNKLLYCIVLYCCRLWADIKDHGAQKLFSRGTCKLSCFTLFFFRRVKAGEKEKESARRGGGGGGGGAGGGGGGCAFSLFPSFPARLLFCDYCHDRRILPSSQRALRLFRVVSGLCDENIKFYLKFRGNFRRFKDEI